MTDSKVFATRIQLLSTALGISMMLLVQFFGVVWWAASVTSKLDAVTSGQEKLASIVEQEQAKTSPLAPQIGFLSAQLTDLKAAIADLKTDLKEARRNIK